MGVFTGVVIFPANAEIGVKALGLQHAGMLLSAPRGEDLYRDGTGAVPATNSRNIQMLPEPPGQIATPAPAWS